MVQASTVSTTRWLPLQGSRASVSRTACSESASTTSTTRRSSASGPPSTTNPESTSASMNAACGSQPLCCSSGTSGLHSGPVRRRTTKYAGVTLVTFPRPHEQHDGSTLEHDRVAAGQPAARSRGEPANRCRRWRSVVTFAFVESLSRMPRWNRRYLVGNQPETCDRRGGLSVPVVGGVAQAWEDGSGDWNRSGATSLRMDGEDRLGSRRSAVASAPAERCFARCPGGQRYRLGGCHVFNPNGRGFAFQPTSVRVVEYDVERT